MDERDAEVLKALGEQGDRPMIPRPVFIWIYGTLDDLWQVAPLLADKGWQQTDPEPADGQYVIRAQREQPASEEAITSMIEEIELAIANTDAEFDGWETSVEFGQ